MVCLTPATVTAEDGPVPVEMRGKPGFFVPSALFERMEIAYESFGSMGAELAERRKEASELRLANTKLTLTASIANMRADIVGNSWDRCEEQLKEAHVMAERAWHEKPALWVGVGAAVTVALAAVVDRSTQ